MTKFGLGDKVIEQINEVFAHYPEIEKVIIYGSRAKGNYKVGSDIDLCLFGKKLDTKIQNKINQNLYDLSIPYEVDLSIHHLIDNVEFLDHIKRIGINFGTPKLKIGTIIQML